MAARPTRALCGPARQSSSGDPAKQPNSSTAGGGPEASKWSGSSFAEKLTVDSKQQSTSTKTNFHYLDARRLDN
jgi:hypothetical protein